MVFTTEIIDDKQKALVISKKNYPFLKQLKKRFSDSSVEYFFSSRQPKDLSRFDYCFFINEFFPNEKINNHPGKKTVYIILKQKTEFLKNKNIPTDVKIITISSTELSPAELEKILWFSFSDTKERHLFINQHFNIKPSPSKFKFDIRLHKYFTLKTLTTLIIMTVLSMHLAFIPFLAVTVYHVYASYKNLKNESYLKTEKSVNHGNFYLNVSKELYVYSRPTLLLFGIAMLPDNMIDAAGKTLNTVQATSSVISEAKIVQSMIFNKNKTEDEKSNLTLRFKKIRSDMDSISENLMVLSQKIPSGPKYFQNIKITVIETVDIIEKSRKLLDYAEKQILSPQIKKYLIFFANNRELRPGGGFLGSFGILRVGNYEIQGIEVVDVYDADGQLTIHIEPPAALSKYLGVPHWFLRDSNFTPDFLQNYEEALFFLEKEMGLTDFDGTVLITTTAIENLLTGFGDIYIPDYKEYINTKNFYLKTQFHVETDFFPGSTQKRNFLSSLMNQLFINFDKVSIRDIGRELKRSLDEKQMVIYVNDPSVQSFLDTSFWSGRVIEPKCTLAQDCVLDYVFPYDANVGANKANHFINKNLYLKTNISDQGEISHILSIQYKNSSPSNVFLTGLYRNYFQVLLPRDSTLKTVTKNGIRIEEISEKDSLSYKLVGFFFEVAPGETVDIKLNYTLNELISQDKKIYQFIIQKQIGAPNSDFVLEFTTGKNIHIVNQNFSPVVKGQEIIYNTNLSTDKIFLVELIKK